MDCDDFLNIDVDKVADFCEHNCTYSHGRLVNKTTGCRIKAVIPVHVFGNPACMEPLMQLAAKYNLTVIEDATESLGSYYTTGAYEGKHTGTVGHIGVYSFNGNKIITSGGGGMLVTDDGELARRATYLTTQAKDDETYYVHDEIGYNYRMSNIQAALGCAQLEKLPEYIHIKRENFNKYKEAVDGIKGLRLIGQPEYAFSNFWLYSLVVEESEYGMNRDTLMQKLAERTIQSRPLWKLNHLQKPYKTCMAYEIDRAPGLGGSVLNIPSSANLSEADIARVVEILEKNAGEA